MNSWRSRTADAGRDVRGFTLLEMLVVMSLLSLVMLAMVSALRTTAQTEERIDHRLARADEMRVATGFLRAVLGRVSARKSPAPPSVGVSSLMFAASAQELTWLGIMPARYGMGGRCHFRLLLEASGGGRALVLQFVPWQGLTLPDWNQAQRYVLVENVTALNFSYEDAALAPPTWVPAWSAPDVLPQRVKLSLRTEAGPWPEIITVMNVLPGSDQSSSGGAVFGGTQ